MYTSSRLRTAINYEMSAGILGEPFIPGAVLITNIPTTGLKIDMFLISKIFYYFNLTSLRMNDE